MKKVLVNYGGAILLYLVIFLGVVAVSLRLEDIWKHEGSMAINN